jgi:predicted transcriptional regulator
VASKRPVSREEFFAICEDHYKRDGFVKWSAVADQLGVTRQAVATRLEKAVRYGHLPEEDYKRWAGTKAREVFSAEREAERADQKRRTIRAVLSQENHDWLASECARRHIRTGDLVNELIDRAKSEPTIATV